LFCLAPCFSPERFLLHAGAGIQQDHDASTLTRRGIRCQRLLKNGRANPRASSISTRHRRMSRKMFSSRLWRVMRGGVCSRNISELNGIFSREVRRMNER
jgi:hypothetical protein